MIKRLLFVGVLGMTTTLTAQTNLGFETWTTSMGIEDPSGWSTLNILSAFSGSDPFVEKSTDAKQGTYSCQMTTREVDFGDGPEAIPGVVAISTAPQEAGIPYTLRPDSLIFWYKYTPQSGDVGAAFLNLTKNGEDVGAAELTLTAQATWKRGAAKIVYDNTMTPDTLNLGFISSAETPVVGSSLKVDAIEIKMAPGTVGIDKNVADAAISIYPNPAKTEIYVRLEKEAEIEIYNVLGSKVATLKSNGTDKTVIPVGDFTNGVYILKTSTGISQRFVVKH